MKRKTSTLETRIWTFGCLDPNPTVEAKLREVVWRAHRYYNGLIEIEQTRRKNIRALGDVPQDKEGFEAADLALKKAVDDACVATGKPRTPAGSFGPRIVGAVRPGVVAQMVSDPKWPEYWRSRMTINEQSNRDIKELRHNSNVPCGTYMLVEKAVEAARKKPGDVKFKPWDQTGRIGIQVIRQPIQDVLNGSCSSLRIVPRGLEFASLQGKKRPDRLEVQLRIGPGKETVHLACVIHREIPDDAVVVNAWVNKRRIGPRFTYDLQLVLESASFGHEVDENLPTIAIDLGWRKLADGGVRTAFWADSTGRTGQVVVPSTVLQGLNYCRSLEGYRAKHHNRALHLLKHWLKSQTLSSDIQAFVSHVHAWKSPKKLAALVPMLLKEKCDNSQVMAAWKLWMQHRLQKKLDLMATYSEIRLWSVQNKIPVDPFMLYLEFWRKKNKHLYLMTESRRSKVLGLRQHVFKNEASRIATQYSRVIFENLNIKAWARDALSDEDDSPDYAHRIRNVASPGHFRLLVTSAIGAQHVQDEEQADSTRMCHICSYVNSEWSHPGKLIQVCAGCGESWDQDLNAAKVLLQRSLNRTHQTTPVSPRKASRPRRKAA